MSLNPPNSVEHIVGSNNSPKLKNVPAKSSSQTALAFSNVSPSSESDCRPSLDQGKSYIP